MSAVICALLFARENSYGSRKYQNRKDSMQKQRLRKAVSTAAMVVEIYVVAKSGGTDPERVISQLRSLIDRARKDQVPAHVISNALDKKRRLVPAGKIYETARYEGFGPANCMLIIECLTGQSLIEHSPRFRNCFTKTKCKIGAPGPLSGPHVRSLCDF